MTKSKLWDITKGRPWVTAVTFLVAVVALIVAIVGLVLALQGRLAGAQVTPYEPTGYTVIRGQDQFPSDLLVLPLEWENSGGQTAVVRYPSLTLHNVESGQDLVLDLAGEYADISAKAFQDAAAYKPERSFLLAPHAVSLRVLAFRVSDWWDEKNENYGFKFLGDECYEVSIGYQINQGAPAEVALFEMPILSTVNRLDPAAGYWWDFWSLKNTSCDK